MMRVLLKQSKPLQVSINGYVLLAFIPFLLFNNPNAFVRVGLLLLGGLVLVGYSVQYEVNKNFINYKLWTFFGFTVFKSKLNLFLPEYISLFSTSFKKDNDWGAVAALGTKSKSSNIVLKFFKGAKNEIVFKCNDYYTALKKAEELSELLDISIHNTFKDSST